LVEDGIDDDATPDHHLVAAGAGAHQRLVGAAAPVEPRHRHGDDGQEKDDEPDGQHDDDEARTIQDLVHGLLPWRRSREHELATPAPQLSTTTEAPAPPPYS